MFGATEATSPSTKALSHPHIAHRQFLSGSRYSIAKGASIFPRAFLMELNFGRFPLNARENMDSPWRALSNTRQGFDKEAPLNPPKNISPNPSTTAAAYELSCRKEPSEDISFPSYPDAAHTRAPWHQQRLPIVFRTCIHQHHLPASHRLWPSEAYFHSSPIAQ